MANGPKVALAVGAGYFLGRTRKMRIALMLAAAGLTGKFPGPGQLVTRGINSLGVSDQVHDLSSQLRGEVLTAARAAAMTAATNRVDALNDRLQGVVPTDDVARTAGSAVGDVTSATGLLNGRRKQVDADDSYDDSYDEDDYDDEPLDVEEEDLDDDDFEEDDLEDLDEYTDLDADNDEPDDEPPRRAARRAASPRSSRPARRTRAGSNGEAQGRPTRRSSAAAKRAPVRRGR
ncbi:hypothetical protein [Mycobacterium sp. 1164985.4]|uniref:hypothetical protein n=1 Tax=Mycobacterium sp. 1164985.4 TaxID=1834069 RepID=UPI000801486D|nr:hypothetical protein [Mycobacterium sp. 1164985.4]OBK76108.1 hypothetical protein A5650_16690 [Mycobacterium sp. 1164985.4]